MIIYVCPKCGSGVEKVIGNNSEQVFKCKKCFIFMTKEVVLLKYVSRWQRYWDEQNKKRVIDSLLQAPVEGG